MLILPSVGASVTRIILNESATKAKLFFSDGSTSIVATKTPTTTSVKKVSSTPMGTSVVKKKVVKKRLTESTGMPAFKTVKTSQGTFTVPTTNHIRSIADPDVANIVERAKKRAAMLESKTMDASQALALKTQEGSPIVLTSET